MPAIVLSSYNRASIQFNKLASIEAERLQNLNATGQIDLKSSGNNIAYKSTANHLTNEAAKLEYEIAKADKTLSTIETSVSAINQMKQLLERAKDLEAAAAVEPDNTLASQYMSQVAELKEQITTMAEVASYQNQNYFNDWGVETVTIDDRTFAITTVDFKDIAKGFAYRGGNILGIESGDFDTSDYPELIAAFGPNTTDNTYQDFTGNYPSGNMFHGATIADVGLNNSYGIDFPTGGTSTSGSHVEIPDVTIPAEVTVGLWAKAESVQRWSKFIKFSDQDQSEVILLTRKNGSNDIRVRVNIGGTSTFTDTTSGPIDNDWAFWSFTIDDNSNNAAPTTDTTVTIYKNGVQVQADTYAVTPSDALYDQDGDDRDRNLIGAGWTGEANLDGAIADFIMIDGAYDSTQMMDYYNDVALAGLENRFFTMPTEKLEDALNKLEAYYSSVEIGIVATRDQLMFKQGLMEQEVTDLISVDDNEVATMLNVAQTQQTLAMTSLSIISQSESNILSLF